MSSETSVQPQIRGTLEVCHVARSVGEWDHYGARGGQRPDVRHMNNTEPTERGWLGNPYELEEETVAERRRVIAAYLRDFLDRVETDPDFRVAVEGLRGQRVACWCRGASQERHPANWCHLDVVRHWLEGDLNPVYWYLRGGNE